MASSNDFVKSNCCVLCDDRHHFRSLREKYEHLRSKKHLFNYLACKFRVAHDTHFDASPAQTRSIAPTS